MLEILRSAQGINLTDFSVLSLYYYIEMRYSTVLEASQTLCPDLNRECREWPRIRDWWSQEDSASATTRLPHQTLLRPSAPSVVNSLAGV